MSMAPSTVRMVLVQGKNGDGATVDQDGFPVAAAADTGNGSTPTAANQAMAAILGTREGATQEGYRLASTGVTCADPVEADALRDALAAHRVENIMLVSAFLAAAALAQSFGNTIGYAHTGLLFIEPECATVAVVDSTSGSISDVRKASLPDDDADAVAELTAMAADVGRLTPTPQGLFVVGSDGVDVGLIKAELEAATPLTVSAPTEPGSALARGAALASAHAPLSDWSTSAVAYAQDPGTGAADPVVPVAEVSGSQQRAYSAEPEGDFYTAVRDADFWAEETDPGRRPFLVALGVLMVFVFGVAALTISLALDIRPSVSNRPSLGKAVVVPAKPAPLPAQVPAAPMVAPAAPAAPAPAAPVPAAPAPGPAAPVIPPVVPVPIAPIPVPIAPIPGPPPVFGPGPLAPGPPPGPPGFGPGVPGMPHGPGPGVPGMPHGPGPGVPGIPHGPGPGLPGIPHGGGGIPHLPGLGGFHL
jgi:hypothetical protein